jgi:hypothetical protein
VLWHFAQVSEIVHTRPMVLDPDSRGSLSIGYAKLNRAMHVREFSCRLAFLLLRRREPAPTCLA